MTIPSERVAARRLNLVTVAQTLIRERGDTGFSMALLAERAGVSATTPYNLLGSKAALLRLVIREDIARFAAHFAGQPVDLPLATLLNAADLLVSHYEADRQFHAGLFRATFSVDAADARGLLAAERRVWWRALVQAAIDGGEIAGLVQAGQLTDALLRTMDSIVQAWLIEDWPPHRFALEMRLGVRLILATVSQPPHQAAMLAALGDLQAAIDANGGAAARDSADVDVAPNAGVDRRAILASRAVIVAFRLFEQVARGAALTIPQYRFLLMLKRGPRRASDLAAFAGIGRSTASALIADMERRGLIFRTRDDGDGRATDLRVTDEGLRRYAELEGKLADSFGTLLSEERDLILDVLARFSESIDRRSRARD